MAALHCRQVSQPGGFSIAFVSLLLPCLVQDPGLCLSLFGGCSICFSSRFELSRVVQSTVKAARSKPSVTVQPFNLLHLDILNVNNVTAGLQQLTKPEDIHGELLHSTTHCRPLEDHSTICT